MPNRERIIALACVVGMAAPAWGRGPEDDAFRAEVAPLIATYCAGCHAGEKPRSGLDLAKFADAASVQKSRKTWDRVREALEVGTMPPEDAPQPPAEQVARAASWIEAQLAKVECQIQQDPGRVTLRRLNRAEYRNTVRDLLGVDYRPTEDFPSDDVGYGFDNIGDVLTLPPLLMERYLAAAEEIAAQAIVDDNPPRPRLKNLVLITPKGQTPPMRGRNGRLLTTYGDLGLTHEFESGGDYIFRVPAYGEQAGDEPARMAFLLDGVEVGRADVKGERDFSNHEVRITVAPGTHQLGVRFLNDFYDPNHPDPNRRDRNLVVRRNFWEVMGPLPGKRELTPASLDGPSPGDRGQDGLLLASNGQVGVAHDFLTAGDYILRVPAYGDQAGAEPVRIAFLLDGVEVGRADVKAERQFQPYELRTRIPPGPHRLEVAFLNDFIDPGNPDPNRRDRNLVVRKDRWELVGPLGREDAPLPESHKRIVFRKPRGFGDTEAIRAILERLATRAYRRPATAEEVTRLLRLVELAKADGDRVEAGLRLALQGILVSPHFLFRVELDPSDGDEAHPINDFELASRIAYFLWSSMPDDELFRAARAGQLRSPGALEAQVERMLKDPRASALTENFAGQWLQLRKLRDFQPDKDRFPGFDEALRASMRRETELFFEAIVREDRSILEFLDSDFTFLNDRLAAHYGLPGGSGEEFRRVTLADDRRGGLLTQASILTVTSNPTRTSPVKRGKWVLEQLLGTPPPPPPPGVPDLPDSKGALTGTLRQRMEQHRANPNCATCHAKMDPLGFGLENFDAIGAWRDRDEGAEIDSSGVLPGGRKFDGPAELRDILKAKDAEFTRCLTEKLLTFALGRGLEETDQCVVDRIAAAVAADGHRMSRLVREIVLSEPFQKRKSRGKGTS